MARRSQQVAGQGGQGVGPGAAAVAAASGIAAMVGAAARYFVGHLLGGMLLVCFTLDLSKKARFSHYVRILAVQYTPTGA